MAIMQFFKHIPCLLFLPFSLRLSIIMFLQFLHSNMATLDLIYSGLSWRSDSKILDKPHHLLLILVKHRSIQACVMYYFFLPCYCSYIARVVLPRHIAQWHLPSVLDGAKIINNFLLLINPLVRFKLFRIIIHLP